MPMIETYEPNRCRLNSQALASNNECRRREGLTTLRTERYPERALRSEETPALLRTVTSQVVAAV